MKKCITQSSSLTLNFVFTTKSQASSQPVMKGETTVAMLVIIFITKKSVRANDEHVWNQKESKMHTEPLFG